MATAILLILSIPAEGFLLYCLFHFSLEMHRQSRQRSHVELRDESSKARVVPLQLLGPSLIAVWSDGTWRRFLASGNDSRLATGTARSPRKINMMRRHEFS
jgi:hypothetical protein